MTVGGAQAVWAGTRQRMEEPIADLSDGCLLPSARLSWEKGSYSQLLMDARGYLDQDSHPPCSGLE